MLYSDLFCIADSFGILLKLIKTPIAYAVPYYQLRELLISEIGPEAGYTLESLQAYSQFIRPLDEHHSKVVQDFTCFYFNIRFWNEWAILNKYHRHFQKFVNSRTFFNSCSFQFSCHYSNFQPTNDHNNQNVLKVNIFVRKSTSVNPA